MKIAFITYEFPPDTLKGGIGTYVKQISAAMAAENFEVHVFAGSTVREGIEKEGLCWIHRVKCTDPIDFRNKIVNSFKLQHEAIRFDLIESPEINGNAWEIKKIFSQLPLIVRLHAPNYLVESLKKKYIPVTNKLRYMLGALRRLKWDMGYWRRYQRDHDPDYHFFKLADGITAPSAAMKSWAVQFWNIPSEKITVIPNIYIPLEEFLSIPVKESSAYRTIVFFGRLNVLKGLVNATKAMKKILKQYPNWQFKVIGDDGPGPSQSITMRTWMKRILKPFENRTEFFDGMQYEELPAALAETDIVLLPSLFESFSYTCAEAMAAGKAIIGSKNGGMADLLQNDKYGIVIDPDSSQEIFYALKRLIDDPALRYELSVKAREKIKNDFNMAKEFGSFYKNFLTQWKN